MESKDGSLNYTQNIEKLLEHKKKKIERYRGIPTYYSLKTCEFSYKHETSAFQGKENTWEVDKKREGLEDTSRDPLENTRRNPFAPSLHF